MRYALCDFSLSGGSEGDRKPSSVSLPVGRDEDHFSRALIAQGLKRPHPPRLSPKDGEIRMGCSHPRVLRESRAYLVLLQVGFTRLPRSLEVPVGSYPAFSTLPCGIGEAPFHRAVSFLWHFTEQSALRTTLPYGARTFLSPGFPVPGKSWEAALSSPSSPPFFLALTIACSIASLARSSASRFSSLGIDSM
jgi:hypothetical protein